MLPSLAIEWSHLPVQLGQIFYFIVLPVLLLAGLGWLLQRPWGWTCLRSAG